MSRNYVRLIIITHVYKNNILFINFQCAKIMRKLNFNSFSHKDNDKFENTTIFKYIITLTT